MFCSVSALSDMKRKRHYTLGCPTQLGESKGDWVNALGSGVIDSLCILLDRAEAVVKRRKGAVATKASREFWRLSEQAQYRRSL